MDTTTIREKLTRYIQTADEKKVAAIYTMVEDEIDTDAQRRRLIKAEREQYLKGEGKSYSPEEVKQMAIDKGERNGL
jgi:hypothetical protein